ncbi:MAG: hypothetical protein GT589_03675 [Peptoclostridium sp.]|uniref:hypothetical protein n=1 Tax=Peptoclostridium sp. TaxID=1904860 RepID=UPI00139E4C7E|nr:hypothetical protein [Peptoclostridium sp.]MZQ75240.1 hypothetical protein [Peptoclostridium sp.]
MNNLKDIERAIQYHKQQLGFERGRDCHRLAKYYELAMCEDYTKRYTSKKYSTIQSNDAVC